jgi:hypothetical protein
MKNIKLSPSLAVICACFTLVTFHSFAATKKPIRSGAPQLGPYIKTENDPHWYPDDSQNPGRWVGGIAGDNPDAMIMGSEEASDAYYPWGYTARYQRRGKLCVATQFATNELGVLVLYEKVRPLIYCNY